MTILISPTKLSPPTYLSASTTTKAALEILRTRLIQRLKSMPSGEVCLVEAAEGYGKTTLVSAWARLALEGENPPVVSWLTLDKSDNDPARFLASLAQALHTAKPGLGLSLLTSLEAPCYPPVPELMSSLVSEIAALDAQIVIVLDDFEKIDTTRIQQVVTFLASNLPLNARVVMLTSSTIPQALAELNQSLGWLHFQEDDLRFSVEEMNELFAAGFKIKLAAEQVVLLMNRTRGMAMELFMAGLALQRNPQAKAMWQSLSDESVPALPLLAGWVLERQMEPVREFLLCTSLLEKLSGELCDDLLRASPSGLQAPGRGQVTLEYLSKNHIFTVALDAQRMWFRYHPVFARFLQNQLNTNHPDLIARLHTRASNWYELKSDLERAFVHALAVGDEERAALLLETRALAMIGEGQLSTTLSWLGQIPAELVLQRPWLGLAEAWATVHEGWEAGVEALLTSVQTSISGTSQYITQRAQGHMNAIRVQLMKDTPEIQHRDDLARQALEFLPPEDRGVRCYIATQLGMSLRQRGRMGAAAEAFTETIACTRQGNQPAASMLAYCRQADLHYYEGLLQKVLALSEEALHLSQDFQQREGYILPYTNLAHLYAALVLFERDELDLAQSHVEQAVSLSNARGVQETAALSYSLLASISNSRGNRPEAQQAIHEARRLLEQARQELDLQAIHWPNRGQKLPGLLGMQPNRAEERIARLYTLWNDKEAAQAWLTESHYSADDPFEFLQVPVYITVGQVLLALGRVLDTRRLVWRLLSICESSGANYSLVRTLVLQAQLMQSTNDYNSALVSMQRALQLAEPERIMRAFMDTVLNITPLIRRLSEGKSGSGHARAILMALERQSYRQNGVSQYTYVPALPVTRSLPPIEQSALSFTEREKEVLRLLESYLTVLEIATRMGISDRTADTLVRNIYRKLGVREPLQAVERAREMRVI
jgi:LuxR family transcriptional regulator, maltose regulon positive regulatory protein